MSNPSAYDTRFTRLLGLLSRLQRAGQLDSTDTEIYLEARCWYYQHRSPKTGRPRKALPASSPYVKPCSRARL